MKTKQWLIYTSVALAVIAVAVCLLLLLLPEEHVHAFSLRETVRAATCSEAGEALLVCSCGEEKRSTLQALEHTPVQISGKKATATEEGLTSGLVCRMCGKVLREQTVLPAIVPWDGSVADSFAGGTGSSSDPYLIANGAQLARLVGMTEQESARYGNRHFQLIQDIDLGGREWTPIGDAACRFSGSLNGGGRYIYNFKITEPAPATNGHEQYYGLFGAIEDGYVRNLHVEDFEIRVAASDATPAVGGVVGYIYKGSLSDCFAKGTVYLSARGTEAGLLAGNALNTTVWDCHAEGELLRAGEDLYHSRAGGLIGYVFGGEISDCTATVRVEGGPCAGGLIGYADGSVCVEGCTAKGNTVAYNESDRSPAYAGGLIGYAEDSSDISHCMAEGEVSACNESSGSLTYVGGLIGYAATGTTVSRSSAAGRVTADGSSLHVGGLIGYCYFIQSVTDCEASGEVYISPTAPTSILAGGLVGCIEDGKILRSVATGNVTAENKPHSGELWMHVGGLVGHADNAALSSCYATGNVSATGNAAIYAGGLLGYAANRDPKPIQYCFATGDVTLTYCVGGLKTPYGHAGGLIGEGGSSRVSSCFATGDVACLGIISPYSIGDLAAGCTPEKESTLFTLAGQRLTVGGEAVAGIVFGSTCTAAQLSDPAFFTDTLGFDSTEWSLAELDFAVGKLPSLKLGGSYGLLE